MTDGHGVIRTFIVDGHALIRVVLTRFLESVADIEVVGEASNLAELVDRASTVQPDVIVMDEYLPATDSATATSVLKEHGILAAIVIISIHLEPDLIRRSFDNGVLGFLSKLEMNELLPEAIRRVHAKGRYLSPRVQAALCEQD